VDERHAHHVARARRPPDRHRLLIEPDGLGHGTLHGGHPCQASERHSQRRAGARRAQQRQAALEQRPRLVRPAKLGAEAALPGEQAPDRRLSVGRQRRQVVAWIGEGRHGPGDGRLALGQPALQLVELPQPVEGGRDALALPSAHRPVPGRPHVVDVGRDRP
jgi:hypothetical protein